jgi:phage-related protein
MHNLNHTVARSTRNLRFKQKPNTTQHQNFEGNDESELRTHTHDTTLRQGKHDEAAGSIKILSNSNSKKNIVSLDLPSFK